MQRKLIISSVLIALFASNFQFGLAKESQPKIIKLREDSPLSRFLITTQKYAENVRAKPLLINKSGKEVDYSDDVIPSGVFSEGLIPCVERRSQTRNWGYMNTSGKVVIEPQYPNVHTFKCGVAVVERQPLPEKTDGRGHLLRHEGQPAGPISIIDKNGKSIKDFDKDEVYSLSDFSEGFAVAYKLNEKRESRPRDNSYSFDIYEKCDRGFCDTKGNITIFSEFDELYPPKEDLARFKLKGKYGFVNTKGEQLIKPIFEGASDFSEGLAAVRTDEGAGFIDKSGNFVIKPKYEAVKNFREGLAAVRSYRKWGFIDKTDKYVIEPRFYLVADSFKNGSAACAIDVDEHFNSRIELIEAKNSSIPYLEVRASSKSDLPLKVDDYFYPVLQFGLIDKSGDWIGAPIFDNIQSESDGVRMVLKDMEYGYIDSLQKEIIKPKYEDARRFSDGLALATKDSNISLEEFGNWQSLEARNNLLNQKNHVIKYTPWDEIEPEVLEKNLAACEEALKQAPNNRLLLEDRAWFNYALNRNNDAIRDYTKAIEIAPSYPENYESRGKVYLRMKKWKEAENDFTSCIMRPKNAMEVISSNPWPQLVLRAQARLGLGDIKGAQQDALEEASMGEFDGLVLKNKQGFSVQKDPVNIDVLEASKAYESAQKLWLMQIPIEDYYPDGQVKYPSTMPEIITKLLEAERNLSDTSNGAPFVRGRKLHKYADLLEDLILAKTARYQVEDLGVQLEKLVKYRENVVACLHAPQRLGARDDMESVNLMHLHVYCGRAKVRLLEYYARRLDSRCEKLYKSILANEIQNLNWKQKASAIYADYLIKMRRVNEADRITDLTAEKYPNLNGLRARCKVLRIQKKVDQIEKLFEKNKSQLVQMPEARELPNAPMPEENSNAADYFELAQSCKYYGLFPTSKFYLDRALKIDSSISQKVKFFSDCNLPDRQISKSILQKYQALLISRKELYDITPDKQIAEDCVTLQPYFLAPYVVLAQIHAKEGNYLEAEKILLKAIEKNPKYIDALIALGQIYSDQAKIEEASNVFNDVSKLDPDNQLVKSEIAILNKLAGLNSQGAN